MTEKELEIQVVKEWWRKLNYLASTQGTHFFKDDPLIVSDHRSTWKDEECVELVVNMYDSYKAKESEKRKKDLLDKKSKLELELAEINRELEVGG